MNESMDWLGLYQQAKKLEESILSEANRYEKEMEKKNPHSKEDDEKTNKIFRNAIEKRRSRSNAKLSPEEQELLDKNGIETSTYKNGWDEKKVQAFNDHRELYNDMEDAKSDGKVNYADRIRKSDGRRYSRTINKSGYVRQDNHEPYHTEKNRWGYKERVQKSTPQTFQNKERAYRNAIEQDDYNSAKDAVQDAKWNRNYYSKEVERTDDEIKKKTAELQKRKEHAQNRLAHADDYKNSKMQQLRDKYKNKKNESVVNEARKNNESIITDEQRKKLKEAFMRRINKEGNK